MMTVSGISEFRGNAPNTATKAHPPEESGLKEFFWALEGLNPEKDFFDVQD
jgi:hypothetical protein